VIAISFKQTTNRTTLRRSVIDSHPPLEVVGIGYLSDDRLDSPDVLKVLELRWGLVRNRFGHT